MKIVSRGTLLGEPIQKAIRHITIKVFSIFVRLKQK